MSVWLCIPSKRPPEQVAPLLAKWHALGYKIALCRDEAEAGDLECDLMESILPYPGYSVATNQLVRLVMRQESSADWFVIGGDDVEPDAAHPAQQIADQCIGYFGGTFGVMQPTGDRWGDTPSSRERFGAERGAYIDRVCGSAWIGREFAQRVYGGRGPLWPGYAHMYADEELQCVAEKLGVLWQRRHLIQLHRHWGRERGLASDMPEFLRKANDEMGKYRQVFEARKAAGFPEATA